MSPYKLVQDRSLHYLFVQCGINRIW